LRVTPHYIERAGAPVVQLDVDIEDGQIQDRVIDNLPTIRKSVVSTQAIVGENQTLLIGGYNTQQRTYNDDRVPGLGRVPVVGLFFSNRINNNQSRERLFMIKPRIVTLPDGSVAAAAAALPADPRLTVVPAPGPLPVTVTPLPAAAPLQAPVRARPAPGLAPLPSAPDAEPITMPRG
jgi:type III secretion protein C